MQVPNKPQLPPPKVMQRIDDEIAYNATTGDLTWINHLYKSRINSIAGYIDGHSYRVITFVVNKKHLHIKAHHIAYYKMRGKWPPREMDHKKGNKIDNRWRKLRLATRNQQMQNIGLRKDNTSGTKGIYWDKNRWKASIRYQGKLIHIGTFLSHEKAVQARKQAEKYYFG